MACPTGAIVEAGKVDARKCISYLTIEHKGPIPIEYRKLIGGRLYGCDECNNACPWNNTVVRQDNTQNAQSKYAIDQDFVIREYPSAREILYLKDKEFTEIFAGSPIHRIKLEKLQRNACIVLGNIGSHEDIEALKHATNSSSAVVKEAAEWALIELKK